MAAAMANNPLVLLEPLAQVTDPVGHRAWLSLGGWRLVTGI